MDKSRNGTKQIRVAYFATLREQRGLSCETVITGVQTARQLYLELADRYSFALTCDQMRIAIDEQFASWDCELPDGASVALIPPVAGG